jgi:YihY family inner membrane protein
MEKSRIKDVFSELKTNFSKALIDVVRQLRNAWSVVIHITGRTFKTMAVARAPEASASIAYYTFFTLFPLILILISVGSYFIDRTTVQLRIQETLYQVFPISTSFITNTINDVLDRRSTVSIISLIGLLWGSSAAFTVIMRHINLAWVETRQRNVLKMRLFSMAIVGFLIILLISFSFLPQILNYLSQYGIVISIDSPFFETPIGHFFSRLTAFMLQVGIFFILYYSVPTVRLHRYSAFLGSLITSAIWQISTTIFIQYFSSGLNRYELVYGSLGAIVTLLLWIYFSSYLILLGAHLTAAIEWRYLQNLKDD